MGTTSEPQVHWVTHALAAFQLVDAAACQTVPFIKADLDRLGCPPDLQRALPFVKAASGVGLLLGRRAPALGRLTAKALVAYFLVACTFHARAGDGIEKYVPIAGLLGAIVVADRDFARIARERIDTSGVDAAPAG